MTHTLTIVGIGNHSMDDLPLGVYRFLKQQQSVYARTLEHPVIKDLKVTLNLKALMTCTKSMINLKQCINILLKL